MSTVISNALKDPMIFLTNGTRIALGLEGPSDRPKSVVQAAQDAYFLKTGNWPYVQNMPNTPSKAPDPDPKPTIGTCSATGDDLTGTNLALTVGAESTVTAAFDGDAEDVTYKWTIRTGTAVSIKGDSTQAEVTFVGGEEGGATLRCTLTSKTASDSPGTITITATVSA